MSRGLEDTTFLGNLFTGTFFKRNQGRLVRRVTAIAVAVVVAFGSWSFSAWMENSTVTSDLPRLVQTLVPLVVALAGFWLAFRVVNWPQFANF